MRAYDRVLVDVDTQVDFLDPKGKLPVPNGPAIYPAMERLFDFARRSGTPVISSADEHSAHDPEFEQFGPHCEAGTAGQCKLSFTVLPRATTIHSGDALLSDVDAMLDEHQQLVFAKANLDVFANPWLGRLIDRLNVGEYIVFGVCTEYCVETAVDGLLARGAKVAVVTDAIRALDETEGARVLQRMADQGVRLIRTADVISGGDSQQK